MRVCGKPNRPAPLSFTNSLEFLNSQFTCPNILPTSPNSFYANSSGIHFDFDNNVNLPSSTWPASMPQLTLADILHAAQTLTLLQFQQKQFYGGSPTCTSPRSTLLTPEVSRKVFVGGLNPNMEKSQVESLFSRFGPVIVDWPRPVTDIKTMNPCSGYAFLIFRQMESVQSLLQSCEMKDDRYYYSFGSTKAQIRPWYLKDCVYTENPGATVDTRNTVFVGGVPRPATAEQLSKLLGRFGKVVFASIDVDPELHYPKGAGRVIFADHKSFLKAIHDRFVKMDTIECHKKDIEIKPYVIENQLCDQCKDCTSTLFCSDIKCLQYYCDICFNDLHKQQPQRNHRIVVRDGERTREITGLRQPRGILEHCMNNLDIMF